MIVTENISNTWVYPVEAAVYDVCLTDLLCVLGSCWQDLAQGVCWSSTLTSTSGTTSSRKSTEDIPWSRGPTLRGKYCNARLVWRFILCNVESSIFEFEVMESVFIIRDFVDVNYVEVWVLYSVGRESVIVRDIFISAWTTYFIFSQTPWKWDIIY